MIKPVNGHILIEPLKHQTFMVSDKTVYQEVGTVVELPKTMCGSSTSEYAGIKKGDKVYFDSWLAGKFPKNDKEDFWLIKWSDVKAVENEISE